MNCKPGDMALVLEPSADAGKIVRCIRIESPPRNLLWNGPTWLVDKPMQWYIHGEPYKKLPYKSDKCLMPIRGEPDWEMIAESAEKPIKQPVKAGDLQ